MKKLTKYFFEGLIVVIPLAATFYLFYITFITIDNIFNLKYPGLGLLITLAGIFIVGVIASNILTKGAIGLLNDIFSRLPLIKLIYNSIKDLTEAFVGDKRRFNKPVSVQLSEDGSIETLGFITEEDLSSIGINRNKVAVYIPQSYNFAGNLIVVPSSRVTMLSASAKEVMTFIVSGGLTSTKGE
ncbi:MAG: DUF502 domain-containing protein [Ignavibacteriaceae bacterium]